MYSIGTDIVSVERIKGMIDKYEKKFLSKVFCSTEIKYCMSKRYPPIHFAGKFCAKEAIKKAIYSSNNKVFIALRDICINNNINGQPFLDTPYIKSDNINISISHTNEYAIAFAMLMSNDKHS